MISSRNEWPNWHEPVPEPGQIIVDVRFAEGGPVTLRHPSEASANSHATDACNALLELPNNPRGITSVAMYRGRPVRS